MYQSTSSSFEDSEDIINSEYEEDSYFLPPDKFDTDGEYIKNGYTPIACYLEDGSYLFLDFLGEMPYYSNEFVPMREGLYLYRGQTIYYCNEGYIEKPKRIIYSWD